MVGAGAAAGQVRGGDQRPGRVRSHPGRRTGRRAPAPWTRPGRRSRRSPGPAPGSCVQPASSSVAAAIAVAGWCAIGSLGWCRSVTSSWVRPGEVPAYDAGGSHEPQEHRGRDRLPGHQTEQHQHLGGARLERRPPPRRTPTKAPGRVTRPTVRVWSKPGVRASFAVGWITSYAASGWSGPPPGRLVGAEVAGDLVEGAPPVRVEAVIMLPITMPAIGMIPGAVEEHHAGGEHQAEHRDDAGRDREPSPGELPLGTFSRPPEVTVATTNISITNANDHSASQGSGDDQGDRGELDDRPHRGGYLLAGPQPADEGGDDRDDDQDHEDRGEPPVRRDWAALEVTSACHGPAATSSRPGSGSPRSRSGGRGWPRWRRSATPSWRRSSSRPPSWRRPSWPGPSCSRRGLLPGGAGCPARPRSSRTIHSSMIRQVVERAARPVSMPRWPPGTISKRSLSTLGTRSTTGRTHATGAMPSQAPRTPAAAVRFGELDLAVVHRDRAARELVALEHPVVELPERPARVGDHVGGEPVRPPRPGRGSRRRRAWPRSRSAW